MSGAILLLPHMPSWRGQGKLYFTLLLEGQANMPRMQSAELSPVFINHAIHVQLMM
jgi:hypothetical protein